MAPLNFHLMTSIFGILGTVGSFLVYLAPIPTFYWIYKKKSTFQFPSLPYSVALFSAMLTLYYAFLKTNSMIIITINSIGILIETGYLVLFLIYTPPQSKIYTAKFFGLFNFLGFGVVVLSTCLIPNDVMRLKIVGWVNIVFGVGVFAAPLIVLKDVIKTKSVEFMSFSLSLSLTLCAVLWFFYGLLIRDVFIAAPNILGFIFGVVQMIMFCIYRKSTKKAGSPDSCQKDQILNTTMVSVPVNTDMKVAMAVIDINTQIQSKTGDAKKSSGTCDIENQQPEQARLDDKLTNDTAVGLTL
ncbi:bidirectional sugar transporter NEC1-like [Argentina anserina]|uniref:bidirectional sugar transporter NEC1-like n=1 Tax=Argentina anserina TaxID=57926 RepID=UPI002176242A|nr:bidirectional sugar transporter NEC1-like [Potentilla anserina]